jgi:hypothetical protein
VLSSADVAAYLATKGITAEIRFEGDLPGMPDEVVVLELPPALSPTYEQQFDRPAVRALVRGKQSDPGSAEALMSAVDAAFLDPVPPLVIGGRHVTNIQQFAGPGFVGLDDPSSRRAVFSATYVLEIARTPISA